MLANLSPAAGRRLALQRIPARRGRRARDDLRHYAPRQDGPFQVPSRIREPMIVLLEPYGNREACYRLLTWLLAANWRRPSGHFTICRETVSLNPAVDLTPDQVRGAIRRLEALGFIERTRIAAFARNREGRLIRDDKGRPHRVPVEFAFGRWIIDALQARNANRRRFSKSPTPRPYGSSIENRGFSTRTVQGRQSRHADSWHSPLPQGGLAAALARMKGAFGVAGAETGDSAHDRERGKIDAAFEKALREFASLPMRPLSDAAKGKGRPK